VSLKIVSEDPRNEKKIILPYWLPLFPILEEIRHNLVRRLLSCFVFERIHVLFSVQRLLILSYFVNILRLSGQITV